MIYAFASISVMNADALTAYRDKAGEALARHGGKVEQASGQSTPLEGAPDLPDVAAILSFPDRAAALSWINDPELAEVHALRNSIGGSDIVLLG